MGIFATKPTPQDLYRAYTDGLPGSVNDEADAELLLEEGLVGAMGNDTTNIKGLHKTRPRVLLFKALRQLDAPGMHDRPGALASEAQTTGDCVSHGVRNCIDGSRAYEIVTLKEGDQWIARGATEYIYAGRGHRGAGMSPQKATRIVNEGQLLRRDYRPEGGPNLKKYNAKIGMSKGGSGIPSKWSEIAQDELYSHKWLNPKTLEDCLDCMAAGFCGHAGSQFGSRPRTGPDGLNTKGASWNHDMAHFGYDMTSEIWKVPVVFIPNSWSAWNEENPVWARHTEILGDWIHGMLVVPFDVFEQHIVRAGSCYYHGHIEGGAIKPLPLIDSGVSEWLAAA